MKRHYRMLVLSVVLFGLATPLFAQGKAGIASPAPPTGAAGAKALDDAMTPGEAQKRLDALVGSFDVTIRTWLNPADPPVLANAVAVTQWVLGNRYIQTMLSGFVGGELVNGIGYAGFDNVQKKYVACYMDSGSTGMEWYTGAMDPDGKTAKLAGTTHDPVTRKPVAIEMRLTIAANGNHVTEIWEADPSGKMWKIMDLQYKRRTP